MQLLVVHLCYLRVTAYLFFADFASRDNGEVRFIVMFYLLCIKVYFFKGETLKYTSFPFARRLCMANNGCSRLVWA